MRQGMQSGGSPRFQELWLENKDREENALRCQEQEARLEHIINSLIEDNAKLAALQKTIHTAVNIAQKLPKIIQSYCQNSFYFLLLTGLKV